MYLLILKTAGQAGKQRGEFGFLKEALFASSVRRCFFARKGIFFALSVRDQNS